MRATPIIGVTPDFNPGNRTDMGGREPTYFLGARYLQAIDDLGGIPLILPLTEDLSTRRQLLQNVDGLLLTGSGPDLHPSSYGERKRYTYRVMSDQRSTFELDMARLAAATRLPVLGICGGMQTINVALGGTLYQDIPSQLPATLQHRQRTRAIHLSHWVQVEPKSLLRRIVARTRIRVNSSHHQSIRNVAPRLFTSARASDGVIEAVESRHHPFLLGVQWHPEFLYGHDAMARRIFTAFLKASRSYSSRS